ncbi:MAG: CaiB/BaiF CoA-transferase family protein, partial [Acidiferrobacterales bacterium]|nr:CaiB/BaiF CoA-transferase family protein [Acidiferrobacterales bacterium]
VAYALAGRMDLDLMEEPLGQDRQGRDVFLKLAADSDVIVESFRPGVVDRLGIGYEHICAVNPSIVYCSISGYGQTGPYRERAGHDIDYCAYAGISDQIGVRDGPPVVPNFQIADLVGGTLSGVMGILAALVDAQRTGHGRYVDVSMTDCALAHSLIPMITQVETGSTRPRGEDFISGGLPCYGIYATADDRYLALGALEQKFWRTFCETVKRPDLIEKHWVSGAEADAVRSEVATIFRTDTQAHWLERFADVDCCIAPVLTLSECMENEQLRAREMFVVDRHPTEGDVPQLAFPVKFSEFAFSIERSAPLHGEHSREILAEAGYNEQRISELEAAGAI